MAESNREAQSEDMFGWPMPTGEDLRDLLAWIAGRLTGALFLIAMMVGLLWTPAAFAQTLPAPAQYPGWGVLGTLEGYYKGPEDDAKFLAFRWIEPGRVLEMEGISRSDRVGRVRIVKQTDGSFRHQSVLPDGTLDRGDSAKILPDGSYEATLGGSFTLRITRFAPNAFVLANSAFAGLGDMVFIRIPEGQYRDAYAAAELSRATASQGRQAATVFRDERPRLALVVGVNRNGSFGDLVNPEADARLIASALRQLGFDVELLLNPDQRVLRGAIQRLGARLEKAGHGSTGLFYFAGHGLQWRGSNYLIPSGAKVEREADLELEAVRADAVLSQMDSTHAATSIIILDACRNAPLFRGSRGSIRGLAQMEAPNGSYIAYSTAPNSVAADGVGANSPFAAALAEAIRRPGQPIEAVFREVRRQVLRATGGLQVPWDSSSLTEPFYFWQPQKR